MKLIKSIVFLSTLAAQITIGSSSQAKLATMIPENTPIVAMLLSMQLPHGLEYYNIEQSGESNNGMVVLRLRPKHTALSEVEQQQLQHEQQKEQDRAKQLLYMNKLLKGKDGNSQETQPSPTAKKNLLQPKKQKQRQNDPRTLRQHKH